MSTVTPIVSPRWLPREQWPFRTSALMATTRQRIAVTDFGGGPTLLFVHVGGWSFICGICYSSSLTSTDA